MPPKAIGRIGPDKTIEVEQREVLNTFGMFLEGLENQCSADPSTIGKVVSSGEAPSGLPRIGKPPSDLEKVVVSLLEVRDELADAFSALSANDSDQRTAGSILSCIRKVEEKVQDIGGDFEPFKPIVHMTGLGSSSQYDLFQNAKQVAENTQKLYSMHKIGKVIVGKTKDGKPGIVIEISGDHNGKSFVTTGKIVAKTDFEGNEAIDYIKDDGKGHMSVKSPKLGRWVDSSDKFVISWQVA